MKKFKVYSTNRIGNVFYVMNYDTTDNWNPSWTWTTESELAQIFDERKLELNTTFKHLPREEVIEPKQWVVVNSLGLVVTANFELDVYNARKFNCKEDAAQHLASAAMRGINNLSLKEVNK